jgi:2-methylisocitrate lyase-like PEP mutase family enzyme
MTSDTRRGRARTLRDAHAEAANGPLVLPNVWGAASAIAYRATGSDCLFVPGVTDPETVTALVGGIDGALNGFSGPNPSVPRLGDLGVARVSVGSGPMRVTLGLPGGTDTALRDQGTCDRIAEGIPYHELHGPLSAPGDGSRV